jgi:vitamin B12 transporter
MAEFLPGETGSRLESGTAPATVSDSARNDRGVIVVRCHCTECGKAPQRSRFQDRSQVRRPAQGSQLPCCGGQPGSVDFLPALSPQRKTDAGVRFGGKMNPNIKLSFLLLLTGSLPGFLIADETETYELKPILVVTPTRMIEPLSDSLASVSLITREDIELSVAEDLFELLRLQPGIDIVRSGGPGAQTSIFMRGSNSNHILVLIDGVRVSSANTGGFVWEQLPLNQVERVEIVRGPRGSLYGSDSIGGVIQIFTRSSPEPYARATGGSYGTAEIDGGLGYRGENTQISINAGYRHVNGFSVQNPDGYSYNPDDDGYENTNLGIRGSTQASFGSWQYSFLGLKSQSEFDQGVSDTNQSVASLGLHGNFTPDWNYQLLAGYTREKLDSDFEFFTTGFKSRRYEFSWQNQYDPGKNARLSFGADYYHENGESLDSWDESRSNAGLFMSYDYYLDKLHLQLGGRYDDNSRFGSEFTGQAALGYELGEAWQVMGSYGSAFRGPNLNEQFSPGFGGLFAGNPDLQPESSDSVELGLRWQHENIGTFTAAVYRTDVKDMISFTGELYQALNIDQALLKGVELNYTLSRAGWLLNANATFQSAENQLTNEPLLRRPDQKGSITVDRRFSNGSWIGMEWFYSGSRPDFGGITLTSYSLVNLRAGWVFSPAWQLELRSDNLANQQYEPAFGFNAPGRAWYISLAWMP